jgi:hypothetical protein
LIQALLGKVQLYEIGRESEYSRLLREMDHLESSAQTTEVRSAIEAFRELIPHPGSNGPPPSLPGPGHLLPEADRQRLFERAKHVSLRAIPLAA